MDAPASASPPVPGLVQTATGKWVTPNELRKRQNFNRRQRARIEADPQFRRHLTQYHNTYQNSRRKIDPEFRSRIDAPVKAATARNKKLIRDLRASGACNVCGGGCEHFHHLDPQTKRFNLGNTTSHSLATVAAEVAKCVCLCAKHHRTVHAGKVKLTNPVRLALSIPSEILQQAGSFSQQEGSHENN